MTGYPFSQQQAAIIRIQSLTFNSRIPDEKLKELTAPGKILKIERGPWKSFMEFRSDKDADTLDKKLKAWFEAWQEATWERQRLEGEAMYEAQVKRCWDNVPGLPAIQTRRGKPTQKGHCYLDDHNKWVFVFPEDPT